MLRVFPRIVCQRSLPHRLRDPSSSVKLSECMRCPQEVKTKINPSLELRSVETILRHLSCEDETFIKPNMLPIRASTSSMSSLPLHESCLCPLTLVPSAPESAHLWPPSFITNYPSLRLAGPRPSPSIAFDRSIGRVSTTALITGYNANQWPKMQKWTKAAIDQTSLKSIALKNLTSRASPTPQVSAHVFAIIWVFEGKGWI